MKLTVKEAADRSKLSRSLVYALCAAGVLRHTRHGRLGRRGCIRIDEEALEEYLRACERERGETGDDGPLTFIR